MRKRWSERLWKVLSSPWFEKLPEKDQDAVIVAIAAPSVIRTIVPRKFRPAALN